MKKALLLLLIPVSTIGYSQLSVPGIYIKNRMAGSGVEKSSFVKGYANNIPAAVMSRFITEYPDAMEVSWYVNHKDITGYFPDAGKDIRVHFRKDGLWVSTRITYDGSLLNEQVRNFLDTEAGTSYTIKYVTEVRKSEETVFEVSLENRTSMQVIRVGQRNGEPMGILEKTRFKKG